MIKRVLIIGIDGMDRVVLEKLLSEMPFFSSNKATEKLLPLESVFPPDTTPAWATIFTGCSPAQHGIINFLNPADKLNGYRPFEVKDELLEGKTFWDIACARGKRVAIVFPFNIYPGWEVKGVMVCRNNKIATKKEPLVFHPRELSQKYPHRAENLNLLSGVVSQKGLSKLANKLLIRMQAEADLAAQILSNEKWELGFIYLSSLDAIQHYFWDKWDCQHPNYTPNDPLSDIVRKFYHIADHAIQQLVNASGKETVVIVLSDHGHGPRPYKIFNVNEVLRREGLLFSCKEKKFVKSGLRKLLFYFVKQYGAGYAAIKFASFFPWWKKVLAPSSNIDWEKTVAYVTDLSTVKSYSYGGIRINAKKLDKVKNDVINDVISILQEQKVVRWVRRREDMLSGPYLEKFPEILIELKQGFGLGWATHCDIITDGDFYKIQPGSHRFDTPILLTHGLDDIGVDVENHLKLMDIAPTVLSLLGIEPPENMQGKSFVKCNG